MVKKLGCSISDDDKQLLDRLTKKSKKNQGELIGYLLRNYEKLSDREKGYEITNSDSVLCLEAFALSEEELKEVEKAKTNSSSELDVIARDGLLQRSRYLNSIADKQAKLESMTDEEMKTATFKGAANFRIEQAIETIMNHNNNESEKSRKVCLTKGIIFKLTNSNRQTINRWFDEHKVKISDHNQKHELTDAVNRKGKGFSFEQLLGVE